MKNHKGLGYFVALMLPIIWSSCSDKKAQMILPAYVHVESENAIEGDTVLQNAMSQMINPSENWLVSRLA